MDSSGKEVGYGLACYGADDMARIKGKRSCDIMKVLGRVDFEEAVHRDNLVIPGR